MMNANTFPREALLAEPVRQQQQEEVGKEEKASMKKTEGGEKEKKGKSKKRRDRRKNNKADATTTAAPTDITLPSPQLPNVAPITPTTAVDAPVPRASAPVPPPLFIFEPITTTFGQSSTASLTLPSLNQPFPFAFGPITTTFTQAPPPPPPPPLLPPHKTFTEVDINLQLTAAKAMAKAEANEEIVAVTKELKALKEELATSKEESNSMKEELAKARDSQKLTQEALDAAKRQLSAINARLDKQRTELDSEQSARQDLEAELVVTRKALVASNKKLSSGLGWRLPLLFLLFLAIPIFFWCTHWATSMHLPLAVVSRIDSAHMYPEEEMSIAWMTMGEFGWFGD